MTEHHFDFTRNPGAIPGSPKRVPVGIVVEAEPNKFVYMQVMANMVLVNMTQENLGDTFPVLGVPWYRIEIEGELIGQRPAERPDWATVDPAEISAAPHQIGAA